MRHAVLWTPDKFGLVHNGEAVETGSGLSPHEILRVQSRTPSTKGLLVLFTLVLFTFLFQLYILEHFDRFGGFPENI
jgi:hypothetical protein